MRADVFIEASVFGFSSRTWTSGLRSRTEVPTPEMEGHFSIITHLERGVQWLVDDDLECYEERPIVLPYPPEPEAAEADRVFLGGGWLLEKEACTTTVLKLPEGKTIAGYAVTGYQLTCAERPRESAILWLASATGSLASAQEETQTYESAYLRARHANVPAEEQPTTTTGMRALNERLGAIIARVVQAHRERLRGFPLGLDVLGWTEQQWQASSLAIFNVTRISTDAIDPTLFAVPEGHERVDDLLEVQEKRRVEWIRLQGLVDDVREVQERIEHGEGVWKP